MSEITAGVLRVVLGYFGICVLGAILPFLFIGVFYAAIFPFLLCMWTWEKLFPRGKPSARRMRALGSYEFSEAAGIDLLVITRRWKPL